MSNEVTNIQDTIRNHPFFAPEHNRVISEFKEEELSVIVKFKEPNDEISSQLVILRGKFREEGTDKIPAYLLFITLGAVVKMEIDDELKTTYKIMLSPMTDDDNIELDYENDFSEEDFFQQSTLHDFRNIQYEHVEVLKDMVDKFVSYEKYCDAKEQQEKQDQQ